ncbi:MAG: DUF4422 domain-containing protein [Prevotella sp.]
MKALYPDYVDDWYEEFTRPYMSYCNMMVCRKPLFDAYCEFLFNVLFDAEKRWNECGIGVAPREMGYISEYLLNTWVRHNRLDTAYFPIQLFEDTSKMGFKVHYLLQHMGLEKLLGSVADRIYMELKRKGWIFH